MIGDARANTAGEVEWKRRDNMGESYWSKTIFEQVFAFAYEGDWQAGRHADKPKSPSMEIFFWGPNHKYFSSFFAIEQK